MPRLFDLWHCARQFIIPSPLLNIMWSLRIQTSSPDSTAEEGTRQSGIGRLINVVVWLTLSACKTHVQCRHMFNLFDIVPASTINHYSVLPLGYHVKISILVSLDPLGHDTSLLHPGSLPLVNPLLHSEQTAKTCELDGTGQYPMLPFALPSTFSRSGVEFYFGRGRVPLSG